VLDFLFVHRPFLDVRHSKNIKKSDKNFGFSPLFGGAAEKINMHQHSLEAMSVFGNIIYLEMRYK